MVLSYLEAFNALQKNTISWNEYFSTLLEPATPNGDWHQDDDMDGIHGALLDTDPFGYSTWCWMKDIERPSGRGTRGASTLISCTHTERNSRRPAD